MPKHLVGGEEITQYEVIYEECYSIDHILLFEDVDQIGIGCSIASDADLIEILAIDLFDKANEQKPIDSGNHFGATRAGNQFGATRQ